MEPTAAAPIRTVRANLREMDASEVVTSSRFCERQTISWLGLIGACNRVGEGDDDGDLTGVESAWKHEVAAIVIVDVVCGSECDFF